jgi:hypothetical protein
MRNAMETTVLLDHDSIKGTIPCFVDARLTLSVISANEIPSLAVTFESDPSMDPTRSFIQSSTTLSVASNGCAGVSEDLPAIRSSANRLELMLVIWLKAISRPGLSVTKPSLGMACRI